MCQMSFYCTVYSLIEFTVQLLKVLSQPAYAEIIAWLPDGKSFTIVKPKAFVADVLSAEFKDAKYSSFTRKLHRWGFQRHLRGEEAGAFFHKLFQRGRLDLVEKMTCYKVDQGKGPGLSGAGLRSASLRDPLGGRIGQQANRNLLAQAQQQPQNLLTPDQLRQPVHTPSQRTGGGNGVGGGDGTVDRLNAAIELEVNRRLKERIAAATLNRQALALMQQQQQLPGMNAEINFEGSSVNNNNMSGIGINLLGKGGNNSFINNNSFITDTSTSMKNHSADETRSSSAGGGQDSLGLNTATMQQQQQQQAQQQWQLQQQQLQLQQLQQQQAQQQQQFQQQGMWGGQPFAFDNNQGI